MSLPPQPGSARPPVGAAEAFDRFYEETAAAIRAYILRHCSDRSATDDLFQTTYFRFLGSAMAATPLAAGARAYLYRIASNVIADHGRGLQRRQKHETEFDEAAAGSADPAFDRDSDLRAALRGLSARERQLLWLVYAEGFTHKEAARIMRLRSASVRVLLFRARRKLAATLEPDSASEEGTQA